MAKIQRGLGMLTKEARARALKEIIGYFQDERGEEIGLIAAEEMLDLFMDTIASEIYNKAIDDAQKVLKTQLESLDVEFALLKKQP